jgi:hypothetical protein
MPEDPISQLAIVSIFSKPRSTVKHYSKVVRIYTLGQLYSQTPYKSTTGPVDPSGPSSSTKSHISLEAHEDLVIINALDLAKRGLGWRKLQTLLRESRFILLILLKKTCEKYVLLK